MRIFFCSLMFVAIAAAQAPAPITPDTVVARTGDGKDITVADVQKFSMVPNAAQSLRQDPSYALGMLAVEKHMSEEAANLKLGENSPWREQLELITQNILMQAMMRYVGDHYQVSVDQTEAYYKQHIGEYQQVNIKAIKINFKPEMKASADDLKRAAEDAFNAAHASTDRSEAGAKKIADEVVKQARAGTDFGALVAKYGEDQSKDFNGDFPPVKQNSMYPPEIKKAVFAMKAGDVSDPVRQSNCFYVIRVTDITAQPLNQVREDIIHVLRTLHTQEYVQQMLAKYKPQILRPDYFSQMDLAVPPK
jgi:peptidyl-prolyl cis-trans isomerase C